jgi:hypothetical protein
MPLQRRPEPTRRGPFWALSYARMPASERAGAVRNEFFGKSPEEINDAAFDLAKHAVAAGNWQALADTLPEMRRMMGAVA